MMDIPACVEHYAYVYQIPAPLVWAIIKVESNGRVFAIARNKNGSADIGLMQINTFWKKTLKKYNIKFERLFEPCANIAVGTWILKREYNRFGNWYIAVAAYNRGPKNWRKGVKYADKVFSIYKSYAYLYKTGKFKVSFHIERMKNQGKTVKSSKGEKDNAT